MIAPPFTGEALASSDFFQPKTIARVTTVAPRFGYAGHYVIPQPKERLMSTEMKLAILTVTGALLLIAVICALIML
ncbi:hypothetical protein [Aeromonas simiae]|uniref:hypothetical protein n=1 Tax=Aeromonas simiae TaxID=218936 RepID=UPI0012EDDC49|nr:hypothetical protein [Aeromonas simiae]MDO2948162.1 hypothetical protein [Aeromonas simiae]MDO2951643.1 hypothetical protein [Aeromonas simiae]MDO2955649.1 hypothetical protein [Aeromonas simiae]